MIVAGEGLGPQPGQVIVNIAGKELQAEVLGWYDLGVRLNVPQAELNGPTQADVIVVRADGAATNPIKITLTPAEAAGPALAPPPPPPTLEALDKGVGSLYFRFKQHAFLVYRSQLKRHTHYRKHVKFLRRAERVDLR